MKKSELIDALAARFEGNRKAAAQALDAVVDTITREIARGEKVAIKGFGTFEKVLPKKLPKGAKRKSSYVPQFSAAKELTGIVSGKVKLPKIPKGVVPAPVAKLAEQAGLTVPQDVEPVRRPAASTATKTTAAKKTTTAKSTTAKKAPAKKTAATTTAKSATTKKAAPAKKTTTAKTTTAKSTAAKTSTAKKTTPAKKSTTAKSATTKKAPAKRTTAKTTTAKKTTPPASSTPPSTPAPANPPEETGSGS